MKKIIKTFLLLFILTNYHIIGKSQVNDTCLLIQKALENNLLEEYLIRNEQIFIVDAMRYYYVEPNVHLNKECDFTFWGQKLVINQARNVDEKMKFWSIMISNFLIKKNKAVINFEYYPHIKSCIPQGGIINGLHLNIAVEVIIDLVNAEIREIHVKDIDIDFDEVKCYQEKYSFFK